MRLLICLTGVLAGSLLTARAQQRLYLDAQLGAEYDFAEGAHFGKGQGPFKARDFGLGVLAAPLLRWQGPTWSVSTGYTSGTAGWGYRLTVPASATHNPSSRGDARKHYTGANLRRIPLLVSHRLTDVDWTLLNTARGPLQLAFRLEGVVGGGLQARGNTCLDCGNLTGGGGRDTITFTPRPYWRRRWGGYLTAGATARFYHRGQERLTLRLLLTQGLQDMIVVPLDYRYNGHRGSTTLHVRGSGVSLAVGYPLKLHPLRGAAPE
ncbi:hypothetical protein LJ737_01475 [Hymenobacter sp. 15J16-1T3B]|uniref:hypothetical protein n=1 Tax=Hymenobacter sp. 15J16-1T3B TaxID=2886941 RepID=UPI001D125896|nr:hypothetical protein [Hymenobacter sp. 15J16-1T3B]MCC3155888.1 hypothetical protein [Hymenobacter sp. 15J16-1T3B]